MDRLLYACPAARLLDDVRIGAFGVVAAQSRPLPLALVQWRAVTRRCQLAPNPPRPASQSARECLDTHVPTVHAAPTFRRCDARGAFPRLGASYGYVAERSPRGLDGVLAGCSLGGGSGAGQARTTSTSQLRDGLPPPYHSVVVRGACPFEPGELGIPLTVHCPQSGATGFKQVIRSPLTGCSHVATSESWCVLGASCIRAAPAVPDTLTSALAGSRSACRMDRG